MSHVPDRHTDHDVELVAASISDDLTAAEHATVTDLLAACSACRELAADLRALAAATAALPVPPRRRDYRITAEQAAQLRPAGVRGILVALGSRRFSFAAPLGTALATLGIVGLLVAAIPGPLAGSATQAPMPELAAPAPAASAPAFSELTTPPPATSAPAAVPSAGAAGAAGEGAGGEAGGAERRQPLTTRASDGPPSGSVGSAGDTQAAERTTTGAPGEGNASAAAPAETAATQDGMLLLASSIAIVAGLVLVLLRWAGRRVVHEA